MSFSEQLEQQQDKEQHLIDEWSAGDYDNPDDGCPNCGRYRVMLCQNTKHRCEKCNWVIEDSNYCPVDM